MRILLDEGVPEIIKRRLTQFSIATVQELEWRGIKNGALLELMAGRFEVIITTDKNLSFQPEITSAIETVRKGETIELKPK